MDSTQFQSKWKQALLAENDKLIQIFIQKCKRFRIPKQLFKKKLKRTTPKHTHKQKNKK